MGFPATSRVTGRMEIGKELMIIRQLIIIRLPPPKKIMILTNLAYVLCYIIFMEAYFKLKLT